MPTKQLSRDQIRCNDIKGPRYTSYPTADQFCHGDWFETYRSTLASTNLAALSLYLHIPFCSTVCFYCGCNKIHTANLKRADSYVQRMTHELAMHSRLIDNPHKVEQLHFGGGTPTFLSDEQFQRLFGTLRDYFYLEEGDSRDFSIEIDPRGIGQERMENLTNLGINRISIGVQDFDPAVQVAVNRIQSVEETREVVDAARANGIRSVNIDLINGLPRQTVSGFSRTLEQVIALQPDRLSLYSYAHLPHRFKPQRQIDPRDLPDAESKVKLFEAAFEALTDAGYEYVGMDHFAKSNDALIRARKRGTLHRNFQGYTTHAHCEQIGIGVSSIGRVGRLYVQNAKTLQAYYQSIDAGELAIEHALVVSDGDAIVAQVIQDLMCRLEVDYEPFRAMTGVEFADHFAAQWPELLHYEEQGLLELNPNRLRVTKQGRFLIRNICMIFDTYLGSERSKFSKAI